MKRKWITDIGAVTQTSTPNKILTLTNQIYTEGNEIYLVPRKTLSDNYTIPLGINKSKWDSRPSHLHDIGCKYHQLIKVNLPIECLSRWLIDFNGKVVCCDIPKEYLEVVDVGFNKCNNLLHGAMRSAGIPNGTCMVYRAGVELNLNWLLTGKESIDIDSIYTNILYT